MSRQDRRKIPIAVQEEKRSQGIKMFKKSIFSVKEIAELLGAPYGIAYRWIIDEKA